MAYKVQPINLQFQRWNTTAALLVCKFCTIYDGKYTIAIMIVKGVVYTVFTNTNKKLCLLKRHGKNALGHNRI